MQCFSNLSKTLPNIEITRRTIKSSDTTKDPNNGLLHYSKAEAIKAWYRGLGSVCECHPKGNLPFKAMAEKKNNYIFFLKAYTSFSK